MISKRRFVDKDGLLPEGQKGCKRGSLGKNDQRLFDKMTFRRAEQTSLAMGWIEYKKASDMIPHPWIVECLGMFGVAENVTSLLVNSMREIDYFIESALYGFLFTSRKTLETNE